MAAELDPFTSSGRLLQVLSYLLWYFCLINLASIGQLLMRCLSRAFVSGSTTSPLKRGPPLAWQCFDTCKHFSDVHSMVKIIWTLQRCQMEESQSYGKIWMTSNSNLAVSRLKKRTTKPCPMHTCTYAWQRILHGTEPNRVSLHLFPTSSPNDSTWKRVCLSWVLIELK